MSRQRNHDEVRAGYIHEMGTELGQFFYAISNEVSWVHWRWKQYRTLFGEKPSRIDLLNQTAPFFFQLVHEVFFEDTLLGIARLVGPPNSVGKPNLAVTRFSELIGDEKLQIEVCSFTEKAKTSAAFAVDWRNRHLAHRDLDLILRTSPAPLAAATREKVEESLSALRDILNCIELRYCKATTVYAYGPTPGDADTLLVVIRDGLLRERERRACWDRGILHEDDINPPEEP